MSNESRTVKASSPTRILAIDGHSLLYRAYFALPDTIHDACGRPANAIHGFVSMLSRLIKEQQPTSVVIAYDSPWPTLRHAAFPGYKANRAALPDALLAQVPLAQTLLKRVGIPTFAVQGYEADDILASLAEHAATQHLPTVIVTGDRDLFQLVRDPWVRVLFTRRGVSNTQVLDEAAVQQLVGVPPSRYADLAALRGDAADNISGIPGIGEKSAVAIIGYAASFEELYRNLERLPTDLARKLGAGRDVLFANRELMRPLSTVPLNWDANVLPLKIDAQQARNAFSELGLTRTGETLVSAHAEISSKPAASAVQSIDPSGGNLVRHANRIWLVSCSGEKTEFEAQAKDLYSSALFKKSRALAELAGGRWYILSAKHGLVAPESSLQPYDTSLKDASRKEREAWGNRVVSQFRSISSPPDLVFLLAGSTYSDAISKSLSDAGYRIARPLEGMSIGRRLRWLNAATDVGAGSADLEELYEILARVASDAGGLVRLSEADRRIWPERGVYFFFEPGETRFCSGRPRVVRVGTHAVSANSKATLWNRLRTHRGVVEGGGNHRSSIFRSHVGTAMIRRDSRVGEFPDWGDQSAGTAENKSVEAQLETEVSAVISQMQVLCLDIRDSSGPRSDRAYIERNAIALLSKIGSRIDAPSDAWLGRFSAHPCIRKSGLWNVNYVDEPTWDPAFLDILDYYGRATTGKAQYAKESIAPSGWWDRTRSPDQMNFRWSDEADDAGQR